MAGQPVCHYSLQPLTLAQGACWKEAVPGLIVLKHNQGNLTFWHLKHKREKKIHGWASLSLSARLCSVLLNYVLRHIWWGCLQICTSALAAFILSDLFHHLLTTCSLWQLTSPHVCPVDTQDTSENTSSLLKATASVKIKISFISNSPVWGKHHGSLKFFLLKDIKERGRLPGH